MLMNTAQLKAIHLLRGEYEMLGCIAGLDLRVGDFRSISEDNSERQGKGSKKEAEKCVNGAQDCPASP